MLVRVIGGLLVLLIIELNSINRLCIIATSIGLAYVHCGSMHWACFMSASIEGMYIADD